MNRTHLDHRLARLGRTLVVPAVPPIPAQPGERPLHGIPLRLLDEPAAPGRAAHHLDHVPGCGRHQPVGQVVVVVLPVGPDVRQSRPVLGRQPAQHRGGERAVVSRRHTHHDDRKASVNPSDPLARPPIHRLQRAACLLNVPQLPGLMPLRSPSRSARLSPSPWDRARSAHAWLRSSSPGGRPPTGRPCISGPSNASNSSRRRTNNSTPASGSSNSNSSDARPTPRPSPTTLPTATERHDHAGNDVESQAPNVGIIPICPPSSSSSNCRPTNSVVPVADSPSPPSPAPMTPRSWRSKSAPTVGCIGGGGIGPPAPVRVIPGSSPRRPPAR